MLLQKKKLNMMPMFSSRGIPNYKWEKGTINFHRSSRAVNGTAEVSVDFVSEQEVQGPWRSA